MEEKKTVQTEVEKPRDRAVLAGLSSPRLDKRDNADEDTLEELGALVETAGGEVAAVVLQNRAAPEPRTFIGEGKVAEIRELDTRSRVSPSQMRVLTQELGGPGPGPQRPDPGHLRPAGQDEGGPSPGGAGPSTSICCPGSPACGPTWSAQAGNQRQGPHRLQGPR